MNTILRNLFFIILLAGGFLTGCSGQPNEVDFKKAEADVHHLTVSLFESMSKGTEENAYQTLFDGKAKASFAVGTFVTISKRIVSKLGALKSLEDGGRSDYDPYSGSWLARTAYIGHFERGDGNIEISALLVGDKWRIMSFNVNSPLLYDNPADYRQMVELYVVNSDLVTPGAHVKVVAQNSNDKVLIKDAQVFNVRWKMSAENVREGFVTLALSKEEGISLKEAGELSVRSIK